MSNPQSEIKGGSLRAPAEGRLWRQGKKGKPVIGERFWSRVAISVPEECWWWTGPIGPWGYGIGYAAGVGSQRTNRIAWVLTNGPIPEGMHVLHRCDNRACCNPGHLYLGTHQQNMRDRDQRGRGARGECNGNARLSLAEVQELRWRREQHGTSWEKLAREFGIGATTARKAALGITWRSA